MLERLWIFTQELTAQASATVAAFAELAVKRVDAIWHPELPPMPLAMPMQLQPQPLSVGDRWERATGAITQAIAGYERVERLQESALFKLDAADYAMQHLLEELNAVIPIMAADGSALRSLLATVGDYDGVADVAEHGTFAA